MRVFLVLLFCSGMAVYLELVGIRFYWKRIAVLPGTRFDSDTLDMAQIFVISLSRRTDRREQMEVLRRALDLQWDYVDAFDALDERVSNIMDHVRWQRTTTRGSNSSFTAFRWPNEIDWLVRSDKPIPFSGADLWSASPKSDYPHQRQHSDSDLHDFNRQPAPLLCATGNDSIVPFVSDLPEYRILSPAKIACWHSHWSVIHRVANDQNKPDVTLILEDDVDIERDIRERLNSVWSLLPATWDIVFLGHCWSDESQKPALPGLLNISDSTNQLISQLHPSTAPKCTHAYALSPSGARRLWLHLRYPPFAYSRALDQAYAWLIAEGRLESYSVVPSVVVQLKSLGSDVMSGNGSGWRETLAKGILGS